MTISNNQYDVAISYHVIACHTISSHRHRHQQQHLPEQQTSATTVGIGIDIVVMITIVIIIMAIFMLNINTSMSSSSSSRNIIAVVMIIFFCVPVKTLVLLAMTKGTKHSGMVRIDHVLLTESNQVPQMPVKLLRQFVSTYEDTHACERAVRTYRALVSKRAEEPC